MNDRLDELIALATLGELTADETTELDALVAADPAAAAELAEALDVAAALQASEMREPPSALRASVLASIASVEQLPADEPVGVGGRPSVPSGVAATPPAGSFRPTSLADVRRRRRFAPLLAAAAALVLIAIGGIVVTTRNNDSPDDPIAAVLDATDVTTRTLDGSLGTTLEVAYSADEGAMVVIGDQVPDIADDETYQIWLVDDTGALPAGTFRPDVSGHVAVRVDVDPSDFVVGVTLEPSGGSEQPTLPILASA